MNVEIARAIKHEMGLLGIGCRVLVEADTLTRPGRFMVVVKGDELFICWCLIEVGKYIIDFDSVATVDNPIGYSDCVERYYISDPESIAKTAAIARSTVLRPMLAKAWAIGLAAASLAFARWMSP